MRINVYRFKVFIFYSIIVLFFSVLISTRDLNIGGSDPFVYKAYFESMAPDNNGDRRFEIGFHLLNFVISKLTSNYHIFLIIFYFLFNAIYISCMVNFTNFQNKSYFLLNHIVFLGLALNSSWYISATVNGLRQGFSLGLLYLALSYRPFNDRKQKIKFLIVLMVSLSFHDSTILVIPFLLMSFLSLNTVIFLFFLFAVLYPFGGNEAIVLQFSNITGIPLHFEISSYAESGNLSNWSGFQIDFFIYSVFWVFSFMLIHFKYFRKNIKSDYVIKILLILTSCYFFYGFGSYSNRFGFIAWLFLPIIQTFYISELMFLKVKNINLVLLMFTLVLLTGILNYYLLLRPFS